MYDRISRSNTNTETITYSIRNGNSDSQIYYQEIKKLSDEVLQFSETSILPVVNEYVRYLDTYNLEEIREHEEYIFELLSFGILWHIYSLTALEVRIAPFITLSKMSEWRKKHQKLKPLIDIARGICTTLFLLPGNHKNQFVEIPNLEQIDHVCKWFEATGEFREQALRFIRWRAFWGTKTQNELFAIFNAINEFSRWFQDLAERKLGQYTENVQPFLDNLRDKYRWREDRIQCTRSRAEYHLNMVGAELMNRAFKKQFNATDDKVVLLPGCMCGKTAAECESEKVKEGLKCTGCLPGCRVNQIREMGIKYNFDVFIIPHASDLSLWSPKPDKIKRGVIASACVTTLIEGGWELKRYDVPAQCVLLDYCGCKKHWHKAGIQTALNLKELKLKILN